MLIKISFFLFIIFQLSYSYKTNPTPWLCTESLNDTTNVFPSCLPGYVIDIENVIYESTNDNTCSGITLCRIENKNTILFSCNHKRTCPINIHNLHFHINKTCSITKRLFIKYRCLPIIQEQKDYLCEQSTQRRLRLGDINLSCIRNYRLYIIKSLIGISIKQQDEINKNSFKCNKDTQTICNYDIPNSYHDICNNQLKDGNDDQCKIKYHERPILKDCQYGMLSNFSMVEYLCIPGDGITEDLPRINICSIETSELISIDRGLLHSPNYPQALGQYLTCKKQLFVPHEARLRLFMLEKSIEYSHELNIYLLNQTRTLVRNELLDINITNQLIQFELKTNHLGDGHFLLYFQIDSRISEYAPFTLELDKNINNDNQHGKTLLSRDWRIIIGCIIGILLLLLIIIAIIFTVIRITKRRRVRSRRYLKSEDDHRQRLNAPTLPSPDRHHRHHGKDLPIEQPYLTSSSPTILPSSSLSVNGNHNRPNSASSTTSSIIIHQINDNLSDRESLIKPINQIQSHSNPTNTDIDNFYEEIKEQQQQTALALGKNDIKGDIVNPYLEPKKIEPKKNLFQGNKSSQPIRDHNESESRYQRPSSSHNTEPSNIVNEEIKHSKKSSPIIPPKRMDIKHSAANAASLHLIDNNDGKDN